MRLEEGDSGGRVAAKVPPAVSTRFALFLIILVAFIVRLLHVISWDPWPTGDMAVFVEMAVRRLSTANLFSPEGACPFPPGYALFLKPFLFLMLPEAAFAAIRIAQAALGALTCLLVFRLARRLHSRRAGLAAALVTCFFHHFIFFSSAYLSENLFIPLWLAALLAILRAESRGGSRRLYAAGLLAGAAFLVSSSAVALAPAALVAACAAARASAGRRAFVQRIARGLLPVVAGGLTLVAPWAIRNWIAIGSPLLVAPASASGQAAGSAEAAAGGSPDLWVPAAGEMDSLTGDPWGSLYVTLHTKWNAFWAGVPPWPLYDLNPSLFAGGLFFPVISWRLVLVGGLTGLGLLIAERARGALVTAFCGATFVAWHLVVIGQPRSRLPLEAIFIAWGGAALAGLAALFRGRVRSRAMSWSLATSLLLVAIATEVSGAAILGRTGSPRAEDLAAHGRPLRLPSKERVIGLFGEEPIPLDRSRGRYLRLSMMARRSGPERATRSSGALRITFFEADGALHPWVNTPVLDLDSLPPDRWVLVEMKHGIRPASVSARVELIPDPGSPDTLRLDQISLHYARGNDLALEFIFPYLRHAE